MPANDDPPSHEDPPTLDELLDLLGDDTRMAIVRALWERFDFSNYVTENREGVPFGALREAAGVADSGNFNYHLGLLTGLLIERREDGYVLSPLGYNLMGAIDKYADYDYETREPRVLADPCPLCDGDLLAEYRREIVAVRCVDCGGLADGGNFTFVELSNAGATDLAMDEMLDAATHSMFSKLRLSLDGTCWECYASPERTIRRCDDHQVQSNGLCQACDRRFASAITLRCPTCGTAGQGPLVEYALVTPAVAAFFDERGIGPTTVGPWQYRLRALAVADEQIPEGDPTTVHFSFDVGGDAVRVRITDQSDGITIDVERN